MIDARSNVARAVNNELIAAYWNIGKIIIEHEQENNDRAVYGKQTLKELSKILTDEFGKGFSLSNIYNMRLFYQTFPKFQTVSGKLSWSHYCELLLISEADKRSFYEKECVNAGWSVRELKRQIETSLYERLLLSSGTDNKERVLELALKGNEIAKPGDIIKDPYVFEFLGIAEDKPMHESDLEKALVEHIKKFLLELGKGFMFVGTQQRITPGFTFGMRLGYIREEYGLTKTAMAKSINVSISTLSSYENDITFPDIKTIRLFCEKYSVNEEWLMTNEAN